MSPAQSISLTAPSPVELRPCPFCGASDSYLQRRDVNGHLAFLNPTDPCTWVACCANDTDCGAEVGRFWTKEEAAAASNRRSVLPDATGSATGGEVAT